MYEYTVHIYTGSQSWAGTNANIHFTLYGSDGESEYHRFENDGTNTFESGMKNSFTIDTKRPLGTLTKVRVGHDNTGVLPAWFLDKIFVEDYNTGKVSEFKCHQWFDTGSGDGKIRRDLRRTAFFIKKEVERVVSAKEITLHKEVNGIHEKAIATCYIQYTISFYTGTEAFAGTDANVSVTLYGAVGESDEFKFKNRGNATFDKGMKSSFPIVSKISLESLTRIRVGHDNKGLFPGWFLNEVELENDSSGEKVRFPCEQWLTANSWFENKEITCDLTTADTVDGPTTPTSLNPTVSDEDKSVFMYKVRIVSEVAYGSLSDDNVVFTLYGKDGESEEQKFNQKEHKTTENRASGIMKFECSKYLGFLERIRIGLDNAKGTSPWVLVTVVDPKSNETIVFICDCCLVNEKHSHVPHEHYSVFVDVKNDVLALDKHDCKDWSKVKHTKDADVRRRSASSPNTPPIIKVAIVVVKMGFTIISIFTFSVIKNFTNWARRRKWDKTFTDIEILEKIGNFTLLKCCLKMPIYLTKREMVLACLDHTDQRYHIQTMCSALHPRVLYDNRNIRAKTFMSGIVIHLLDNETTDLVRMTVISQVDLGGWMRPGAQVEYLANTPIEQMDILKNYLKHKQVTIKTGSPEDRKSDTQRKNSNNKKSPNTAVTADNGPKFIEVEDNTTGEVTEFECNQWFDNDSGDGHIRRDLRPTGRFQKKTYLYKISFHTGSVMFAGTDANIFATIFGTKGDSGEVKFQNQGDTTFENRMVDIYNVETKSPLGTLTKVRVGHDNTGLGPGWFLDKITIEDTVNNHTVVFPCSRWLATNADDGMIERQLIGDDFDNRDAEAKRREKEEEEEEERKRKEEEEKRRKLEEERKKKEEEQKQKLEDETKKKDEETRRRIEEERIKREERRRRRDSEIAKEEEEEKERKRKGKEERKRQEDERKREEEEKRRKEEEEKRKKEEAERNRKDEEAAARREEEERKRQAEEEKRRKEEEEKRENEEREKRRSLFLEEQERKRLRTLYKVNLFTEDAFGAWTGANVLLTLFGTDGQSNELNIKSEGPHSFHRDGM
ncbi:hypothetical protein QZH41_020133 [Actinostola sp. cb2023]|nr:hypothetical protein QZH41_020133 [Actinostola sp. cb2023]